MTEVELFDAELFGAGQRAIAECMSASGFDYLPPVVQPSNDTEFERARNPLNRTYAAVSGYHLPTFDAPFVDNNSHTAPFDLALFGPDDGQNGGCLAHGSAEVKELASGLLEELQSLLNLLAEATEGFFESEDGRNLTADWGACMRTHGYPFSSQPAAAAAFDDGPVSDEEIVVRLVDLDCDVALGVTAARSAWERQRFEEWVAEFGDAWAELLARIVEATKRIVGDI